ncbi:MAG TPA: hypothetical protein VFO17_00035 [Acidimicrobiia bacterium]|jgi:peroxiredoxin|nr:hypothetical protein [Acidimicrobiia bacterium]
MAPSSNRGLAHGSGEALRPGDVAPDFELRRTFEQNVSLSGLLEQGPALIAFYVFDFGHV